MKQKNMYSFFLEIIFCLILLTISTVVSLLLFANAAKIDNDNRAVASITQEMVGYSEILRSPDNKYQVKFKAADPTEKAYLYSYDAKGNLTTSKAIYQLAVYIRSEASGELSFRKSRLELIDLRDRKIIAGWMISTLAQVNP